MKNILAVLIIAVLETSCGKRCPCADDGTQPAFIGYSASEIDTIIIKSFEKGSNFSRQLDSFALTSANTVYNSSGDTLTIGIMAGNHRVSNEFDWQIINPFDNRTFRITEITTEKRSQHCGGLFGMDKQLCVNPIVSFKKDGALVTLKSNEFSQPIYIKK